MQRIYLDHASTTYLYPEVIDAMTEVMKEVHGNPSSIHHHGRTARSIVEDARKTIANGLRASIGEIFFTSSATEANNTILKNAVTHLGVKRIISSPLEHHCVLHTLDYIDTNHPEVEIIYLKVDSFGNPDFEELALLVKDDIHTLVSLMYINNEIGNVLHLNKVSKLCQENNVLFHCDAVQAIGKINVDVSETYFSFLTSSGHKFHGPKGTGFFYMNGNNIIPPYLHGGAQERNMRAGTENIYGIVGMAKALQLNLENMKENRENILALRQYLISSLDNKLDDIIYNGNQEDYYAPHILSVSFPASEKADMLMFNLDISGISASSGSACSSGIENDSHVLQAIGHPEERKTIRFSFSPTNTMQEIDIVTEKLSKVSPIKVR